MDFRGLLWVMLLVLLVPLPAFASLDASMTTSSMAVQKNSIFEIRSQVICLQDQCENVKAWLDPIGLKGLGDTNATWVGLTILALFVLIGLQALLMVIDRFDSKLGTGLFVISFVMILILGAFNYYGGITGFGIGNLVDTKVGATPFYTLDLNPQDCGLMQMGGICKNSWQVNATGIPDIYEFFVIYNATNSAQHNTLPINITLSRAKTSIIQRFWR
jgi:hypothetical protein